MSSEPPSGAEAHSASEGSPAPLDGAIDTATRLLQISKGADATGYERAEAVFTALIDGWGDIDDPQVLERLNSLSSIAAAALLRALEERDQALKELAELRKGRARR
jgi:hypothetical protein